MGIKKNFLFLIKNFNISKIVSIQNFKKNSNLCQR